MISGILSPRPVIIIQKRGGKENYSASDYNAMRTQPTLTLADMKEETGVSMTAIQKLLEQLISQKYVERREKDRSWRVFVTQ